LGDFREEFLDNARYMICELYCRIHHIIDIRWDSFLASFSSTSILLDLSCRDLSQRLNLSEEEGEKWIVNLIRETRMGADAKIDLEKVDHFYLSFATPVCLHFFPATI